MNKTAVIIIHGMGQQVRFQTLSQLAEKLGDIAKASAGDEVKISTRLVNIGSTTLARAEMELAKNGISRHVHVYEVYWAPLTEGKVNARDVISFFWKNGLNGIGYAAKGRFRRWMFNEFKLFKFNPVKAFLGLFSVLFLLAVILILYIAGAVLLSFNLLNILYSVLFVIFTVAVYFVKNILVQYPGDVAAYVSSNAVDKFYELRAKIQESSLKVCKAVYSDSEYDRIIVAGHSLGSVIAYDTLNALINTDRVSTGEKIDAAGRTKLFLTFGSPLDKTAFIFRVQVKDSIVREMLAAEYQPMIMGYDYRPEKWINIYSPADVISSKLDFYDSLTDNNRSIQNIRDKKARIPLYAHVQYWNSSLWISKIYEHIF